VYVSSEWQGSPAKGLARLDATAPLAAPGKIAHVALVYSPSEPSRPSATETLATLARAVHTHAHYTSALGALRMVLSDARAALHAGENDGRRSSLRVRDDLHPQRHRGLPGWLALHRAHPGEADPAPPPGGVLRALEDDIATYIASNELRERERTFLQDALLMLLDRDQDVSGLVINAHSQGTVLCWDVLRRLPFSAWARDGDPRAQRIAHLVTAGTPIRKYVDMFTWGDEIGELAAVIAAERLRWSNFCDPRDPVADPLNPSAHWRAGDPWQEQPPPERGLLGARDPVGGTIAPVRIADIAVDNLAHSPAGGLQAHDYWGNTVEFVPALAGVLASPTEDPAPSPRSAPPPGAPAR
jgi:hypothetical protein